MAESKHLMRDMPPLRPKGEEAAPEASDREDGKRVNFVKGMWSSQNWALNARDRQIEENVRMLAGQHWLVRSDLLNKWIDITEYLTDEERRWRQRPVVNRLLFWFMLTHARATENPPVITFQPSSLDRGDAQLAEVMDTVFKTLWRELDMLDVVDRLFSWLIPGGISYVKTRVDTTKGPLRDWIAPLIVQGPDGPVTIPSVPFNEKGEPLISLQADGQFQFTGEPFSDREGQLAIDVLSPMEVRAQWGPQPWRDKRWVIHRSLLTPEEVFDTWGVEVEPDTFGPEVEGNDELRRLLYGGGYFGAAGNDPHAGGSDPTVKSGFVTVDEMWHCPTRKFPQMEQTDDSPGGRLTVVAAQTCLFDGPRPAFFKGAGPIEQFEFVRLPGRPNATSPQEMLNPLQRTYNRGYAQILEHRNLTTNPITVVDEQSGLDAEQLENKPGLIVTVLKRAGVAPVEYVQPPRLGDDVYKVQAMLQEEMSFLGNLEGTRGEPPTRDASGELVKELRFNTDRFLGPTMRRTVVSLAHVVEDWISWLPIVWDQEKVIAYAGEDQVARTVTVLPEMFNQAKLNVVPDIESMLPEGRGERQQRVFGLFAAGALGPDPESNRRAFLELAKFPHMGRMHRPGGVDRVTAEQENGLMVRGVPAEMVPVLEWYSHEEHLFVHENFMKSPEFLKLPPPVQLEFAKHRAIHSQWLQLIQQQQLEAELAIQERLAEAQNAGNESSEGAGGANGSRPSSRKAPSGGSQGVAPALPDLPRSQNRGFDPIRS